MDESMLPNIYIENDDLDSPAKINFILPRPKSSSGSTVYTTNAARTPSPYHTPTEIRNGKNYSGILQ